MNKYPQRKRLRMQGYDYGQEGAYFVTVCTKEKICYFEEHPMLKDIVEKQWQALADRFGNIELDEYVVMPNHVHGIVWIVDREKTSQRRGGACPRPRPSGHPRLGEIIGAYKSLCVHEWLKHIKTQGLKANASIWQRGYHEHVIRSEEDLQRIREYIRNNPRQWEEDEENPNKK